LFDSIEEMQEYENPQQDDIAIVYDQDNNNYQGIFKYDVDTWIVAPTGLSASAREVMNPKVFQR
jgi:hypothetical protein